MSNNNKYVFIIINYICYISRILGQGFKLFLTAPGETIRFTQNTIRVPLLEQVSILLKPTLIYSSSALNKYTPSQRQCFFKTERRLRFFKIYTQDNCQEECLANFTLIQCGCVKFSVPSMC